MRYVQRTTLVSIVLLLPIAAAMGGLKDDPPPPDEGAFTYMGELHRLGESYTGTADFRFTLWDDPVAGSETAPMQERAKLAVSDGLFQARLRFDETMFDGAARWLEIEVRTPSGEGRFTTLAPRQEIVSSRHDLRTVEENEVGDEGGDDSIVRDESDQQGSDGRAGDGASSLRQDRSSGVLRDDSAVGPDGIPTALRRADSLGDDGIEIASPSPWKPDGNGIHYKVANVGIGTNAASNFRLSVRGDRAIFARSDSQRGRALFGLANSTTGKNFGVYGLSKSSTGRGIFGGATARSGEAFGVWGKSNSTDGRGVVGDATATTGTTYGVWGESASTSGQGVFGWATATTGTTYGGRFESASTIGTGVYGYASALSGLPNRGVYGRSNSSSGRGVYGYAANTGGLNYGVYGQTQSSTGRGVFGYATQISGLNSGVYGQTQSTSGTGVSGIAVASTGTNYGVRGETQSSTGYAGYFTGGRNYFQGNVGIAQTGPQRRLHVTGGNPATAGIRIDYQGFYGGLELRRDSTSLAFLWQLRDSDGTLRSDSHYGLSGDRLYITNNGNGDTTGVYLAVGGTSWTSTSDRRFKDNIRDVNYGLDEVLALRPRDFVWKDNGLDDTGFIAQEVFEVFPQAVTPTEDDEPVEGVAEPGWGVTYDKFTPLLVSAIQDLAQQVDDRNAEIDLLKERLSALESVVERLVSEQKGSAQ